MAGLDHVQQLAVARALATPDLALIQGYPGTGKTRVVAELLRQADRQGLRTLLLSASAAALDRALEHLAADTSVRAVRCLSAQESLQALPGCVARLTLRIPYADGPALAACYERGRVLSRQDEPEGIRVEVEMPRRLMASFEGYRLKA